MKIRCEVELDEWIDDGMLSSIIEDRLITEIYNRVMECSEVKELMNRGEEAARQRVLEKLKEL